MLVVIVLVVIMLDSNGLVVVAFVVTVLAVIAFVVFAPAMDLRLVSVMVGVI